MIKTLNISGETTVDLSTGGNNTYFSENKKYCRIDNKSENNVYVSLSPNVAAGKDGVLEISTQSNGTLELTPANKIYVSGSGKIQIQTSSIPLKTSTSGGGGEEAKQLGIYPIDETGLPTGDVTVPDNVVNLSSKVFSQNSNITSVHLPEGMQTLSANCFQYCSSLKNINLPNSITNIGSMGFSGCTSLRDVFPSENASYILNSECFYRCNSLTNESVKRILEHSSTVYSSVFRSCTGLTDIEVPFVWSYMFLECSNLVRAKVLGGDDMGTGAFRFCNKLQEAYLEEGVNDIGSILFDGCKALKIVTLPSTISATKDAFNSKSGNYAFSGCTALEDVRLCRDWSLSLCLDISENLTHDSMIAMFNNLRDLTGETSLTFTLGSVNLAKLTDEEKAIATNKNWVLA